MQESDMVTKDFVRAEIAEVRVEMAEVMTEIASVRTEMASGESRILKTTMAAVGAIVTAAVIPLYFVMFQISKDVGTLTAKVDQIVVEVDKIKTGLK